ncbi:MAG: 4-(cytidine 5'-diphospho)-2-C-methyl-D-erythritol kinase [Gammaproteobacteria bacterium]|nr:4-(cytidine 5'-diphospho)-2-C-methyl-D-erythritol kinase [Gammaproteobacteria bacterium]
MNHTPESWPAPAKINLFLHITGRREDGYHLLQTVFQFIDYCDLIHFDITKNGEIRCITPLPGVSAENNLMVRAARLLKAKAECDHCGVNISIDKKLPIGGGLGGGSSDAATTLIALNYLWGLGLPKDELATLGLQLGADVPVFVHGAAAWAEGVGENLQPIELAEPWFLVVAPDCQISTAEIFSSSQLTRDSNPITMRHFFAGEGVNVCETVVFERYPEVAVALDWLNQFSNARMSGTGACIFAAFNSENEACRVLNLLPDKWKGFVGRGRNKSPLIEAINGNYSGVS